VERHVAPVAPVPVQHHRPGVSSARRAILQPVVFHALLPDPAGDRIGTGRANARGASLPGAPVRCTPDGRRDTHVLRARGSRGAATDRRDLVGGDRADFPSSPRTGGWPGRSAAIPGGLLGSSRRARGDLPVGVGGRGRCGEDPGDLRSLPDDARCGGAAGMRGRNALRPASPAAAEHNAGRGGHSRPGSGSDRHPVPVRPPVHAGQPQPPHARNHAGPAHCR